MSNFLLLLIQDGMVYTILDGMSLVVQAISGPGSTTEAAEYCTDEICVIPGLDYNGNDMYKNISATKEECSCICKGDHSCQAWTFVGKNQGGYKIDGEDT